MTKNKIKKLSIIALTGLVAVGAYAFIKDSRVQSGTNLIKPGVISITFDNETDAISLSGNEAIPMSDEYAKNNITPYKFYIVNDGDVPLVYSLYINDLNSTFDTSKIRMIIKDEDHQAVLPTINNFYVSNEEKSPLDGSLYLEPGQKHSYELIVYIDRSAKLEDYQGKEISFKLEAVAEQAHGNFIDSEILTENMYYIQETNTSDRLITEAYYNHMLEYGWPNPNASYELYNGTVYEYSALLKDQEGYQHADTYYYIDQSERLLFETDGGGVIILKSDETDDAGRPYSEYQVGDMILGSNTITGIQALEYVGIAEGNYYSESYSFGSLPTLYNEYEKEAFINDGSYDSTDFQIFDGSIYHFDVNYEMGPYNPY